MSKKIIVILAFLMALVFSLFLWIKPPHNVRTITPNSPEIIAHQKAMEESFKKNGYYTKKDMDKLDQLMKKYINEEIYKNEK